MLHTPNIELTKVSAQALELPLILGFSKGEREKELAEIKQTILSAKKDFGIEGIGTGAIGSNYQKTRIEAIASGCNLFVKCPIWGIDQKAYLRALLRENYHFILTAVSCEGLDQTWLGREVDEQDILQLEKLAAKFGFNVAFEGGEAETLVLDCPLFPRKTIKILSSKIEWNGYYGRLIIERAILEDKGRPGDKR